MSDGDYRWRFECVGGPLDGERFAFPVEVHDGYSYLFEPQDFDEKFLQGSSRYKLCRDADGIRRLHYVENQKDLLL